MSDIIDTLHSLFPGVSDSEIQSYANNPKITSVIAQLLPSDKQTEDDSIPPTTSTSGDLTVNPDVAGLKIPLANSVQSSFDVTPSASTVTMNGAMPSSPTGNVTQPNPSLPAPTPEQITPSPITPNVPTTPSVPSTPGQGTPTTPSPTTTGEAPLAQNLSDNDERQKMLAQEAQKRQEGVLPIIAGGLGDTLSTASTVFGAKEGTPVLDKIVDMESKDITEDKVQFEDNLKNDPNSDVSKSYQKVLGMMMGKPATDPDIQKMSAVTIASQLPEVEKFMAKEVSLQQIQATKQLTMSQQQGNERDRMWNQAVQTINQIRGDKPLVDSEVMRNGAISAYQAIDNIQKQGRAPNQIEYIDLLGQLWKARTGATLTNEELKAMDPKTIQSQLGPIATFFTGDPKAITTPAATNAIKQFVIQSGKTADQIHDQYMQTRGVGAAASRMQQLYPDDAARLSKMARGLSFSDATGISYKNPAQTNPSAVPTITSQQDYDQLPSGASYQDTSGKVYRKK